MGEVENNLTNVEQRRFSGSATCKLDKLAN